MKTIDNSIPQGWQCPVCGKVMSPSTQECVNDHAQVEASECKLTDEQVAEIARAFKEMQDAPPKIYSTRIHWVYEPLPTVTPTWEWMKPPYKITGGSISG